MRKYRIRNTDPDDPGSESCLLELPSLTDFSIEEFDAVADLKPGEHLYLYEQENQTPSILIERLT